MFRLCYDRFKFQSAVHESLMDEYLVDGDLSEVFQLIVEDERRRRYLKEIGDWLIEEQFELNQAS